MSCHHRHYCYAIENHLFYFEHNYATMSMIRCDVESSLKKGSNGMKVIAFNFYSPNEIKSLTFSFFSIKYRLFQFFGMEDMKNFQYRWFYNGFLSIFIELVTVRKFLVPSYMYVHITLLHSIVFCYHCYIFIKHYISLHLLFFYLSSYPYNNILTS